MEKSIFLDTNALIELIQNEKIIESKNSEGVKFVTFEKCLYEWKNGVKRYFIDATFIVSAIKKRIIVEKYELKEAQLIINRVLGLLKLDVSETNKLIKALKKYDLGFEFGIALENQYIDLQYMEERFNKWVTSNDREKTETLRLKQFYKCIRQELRDSFNRMDNKIQSHNIRVLYYDEVFGNSRKATQFREILNNAYLPTEDLEIVFACLSSHCQVFMTNDYELIKRSRTLGLNHIVSFIHVENLKEVSESS